MKPPGRGAERRRAPGNETAVPAHRPATAGRAARGRPAGQPSASRAAPRARAGCLQQPRPGPQRPGPYVRSDPGRAPHEDLGQTTARLGPSAGRRHSLGRAPVIGGRPWPATPIPRTAGREANALAGGGVEPLGVVDDDQDRPGAGRDGQQPNRAPKAPPTGRPATVARARAPLRARQPAAPGGSAEPVEHRSEQVRQSWRTRDRPRSAHPKPAGRSRRHRSGAPARRARRLPDPGLTA